VAAANTTESFLLNATPLLLLKVITTAYMLDQVRKNTPHCERSQLLAPHLGHY
jgi:hypothetical protein